MGCGVVLCGVVLRWKDVVWFGLLWFGVAWCNSLLRGLGIRFSGKGWVQQI